MKAREIDADLDKLAGFLCKTLGNERDHLHMLLPKIILFDANQLIRNNGDCRDPNKLQLTQFVKNAWEFHVHIVNWPVGVPGIECGVMSKKGFRQGFSQVHAISPAELSAICKTRVALLIAQLEGKDIEDSGDCVEMVSWDKEEIDLPIEDQHNIALVTDTKGNVVVAVSNSPTYQAAMGTEDLEEEEDQGDKDPTLWADSTLPCPTCRPVLCFSHARLMSRSPSTSGSSFSGSTFNPNRFSTETSSSRTFTHISDPIRFPARPLRTSHLPSRQSAAPPSQPPAASHASQPSRDQRGGVHGTCRPLSPVGEESERLTKQLKQSSVSKQCDALCDALKKKLGTRK
ncbi:hypothetical protein BT96DRAFT_1005185 [Gymnopus androsaceus JB14]|uniref:Uncharacterized protein n=1 Tax=Gymnopus androsaceus JB14 TaxID=1447944 RepID=A0A6A4GPU0_9AGAR|nr:hypothetical protein BT96DRAFT_1005185 [Gymnopus androsaceus JB14]